MEYCLQSAFRPNPRRKPQCATTGQPDARHYTVYRIELANHSDYVGSRQKFQFPRRSTKQWAIFRPRKISRNVPMRFTRREAAKAEASCKTGSLRRRNWARNMRPPRKGGPKQAWRVHLGPVPNHALNRAPEHNTPTRPAPDFPVVIPVRCRGAQCKSLCIAPSAYSSHIDLAPLSAWLRAVMRASGSIRGVRETS